MSKQIIVLIMLTLGMAQVAHSQTSPIYKVANPDSIIYEQANARSKKIGQLKKGTQLTIDGVETEDFSKSIANLVGLYWIKSTDVQTMNPVNVDEDIDLEDLPKPELGKRGHPLTYDLGFATGSSMGRSYSEFTVGLNYGVNEWLVWRNAAFYRAISGTSFFGLDSSGLAQYVTRISKSVAVKAFAGPGVRLPSKGKVVPFVEGGVIFGLGGVTVGAGLKSLIYPLVDSRLTSDTQFFLILTGSGEL